MTEEELTIALLEYLQANEWDIVCYDFPQSGTGRMIHPDDTNSKTEGGIIPDIVAVKKGVCLFFENKDHYDHPDFEKQGSLRSTTKYMKSIRQLLKGKNYSKIYYGIAIPEKSVVCVTNDDKNLIDFIITLDNNLNPNIFYNSFGLIL